MINSIYSTALFGLQRNQQAFQRHAEELSRLGTNEGEDVFIPDNVVGLATASRGMQANMAVLARADEALGTLLDTFA